MSNPRYEGFNKDGSKFTVAAKTAVQDIRQQGPIDLIEIDSRIVQAEQQRRHADRAARPVRQQDQSARAVRRHQDQGRGRHARGPDARDDL